MSNRMNLDGFLASTCDGRSNKALGGATIHLGTILLVMKPGFRFYKWNGSVSESWAVKCHGLYETKLGQSHHFSSYS
jgi:hypothetical protein